MTKVKLQCGRRYVAVKKGEPNLELDQKVRTSFIVWGEDAIKYQIRANFSPRFLIGQHGKIAGNINYTRTQAQEFFVYSEQGSTVYLSQKHYFTFSTLVIIDYTPGQVVV